MTVGELKNILEDYDEDLPVCFRHMVLISLQNLMM